MADDESKEISSVSYTVDAHAHLYDTYSVPRWLTAIQKNIILPKTPTIPAIVCVDRVGQCTLKVFQLSHKRGECSVEAVCDDDSIVVVPGRSQLPVESEKHLASVPVHIVPGSQSVSREGLEVLGIGVWTRPKEQDSAIEQVKAILDAGGLPCIPWSPGKWLAKRGKMVRILFDTFGPHQLTVGDIALRTSWGPPSPLLHHARSSGFPVLLGTDPLPFSGEEDLVGSFGMTLRGPPPGHQGIVAWLLEVLRDPSKVLGVHGMRNTVAQGVGRFVRSHVG